MWLAKVHVTLKPVVLDPQGQAIQGGLHQLGFEGSRASAPASTWRSSWMLLTGKRPSGWPERCA